MSQSTCRQVSSETITGGVWSGARSFVAHPANAIIKATIKATIKERRFKVAVL
jgi:hypothetical protein